LKLWYSILYQFCKTKEPPCQLLFGSLYKIFCHLESLLITFYITHTKCSDISPSVLPNVPTHFRSRGSSDSIVSGYGLDDRAIEVRSPAEAKRSFALASVSRPALGPTQPPLQWVLWGVLSLGVKRNQSMMNIRPPLLSAEVVNE
jgi:hypothetical protein